MLWIARRIEREPMEKPGPPFPIRSQAAVLDVPEGFASGGARHSGERYA